MSLRSNLYRSARMLGDKQAAASGDPTRARAHDRCSKAGSSRNASGAPRHLGRGTRPVDPLGRPYGTGTVTVVIGVVTVAVVPVGVVTVAAVIGVLTVTVAATVAAQRHVSLSFPARIGVCNVCRASTTSAAPRTLTSTYRAPGLGARRRVASN